MQATVFRSRLQRDSLVLRMIKRSVINIRRSMLDVRCSTFNLFTVPGRRSFIQASPLAKKTASLIEKETLALCYRRVGHRADRYWRARWPALLHENGIEIHVVSYEGSEVQGFRVRGSAQPPAKKRPV